MSPLLVQSIRSVKPISFASSMQRAKEGDRSHNRMNPFSLLASGATTEQMADLIAQQNDYSAMKPQMIFPRLSTLALVQMLPPRSVSPARVQDYATMASSNEEEADFGVGQLFDMHA